MKIEILGMGCLKYKTLEQNTKEAVAKSGKFAQVIKVEEIGKIIQYGVLSTPALVIDEKVVSSGRVLSVDEILRFIG